MAVIASTCRRLSSLSPIVIVSSLLDWGRHGVPSGGSIKRRAAPEWVIKWGVQGDLYRESPLRARQPSPPGAPVVAYGPRSGGVTLVTGAVGICSFRGMGGTVA